MPPGGQELSESGIHSRPSAADEERFLRSGDLTVDIVAYRVFWRDMMIDLAPTEYRLLCHFLRYPSSVFSREQLIAALHPHVRMLNVRTIDCHIGRLRRTLAAHGHPNLIRTVRNAGYALAGTDL